MKTTHRCSKISDGLTSSNHAATALALLIFALASTSSLADWSITPLPICGLAPSINTSGEIVWYENSGRGIYSNIRGKLSNTGLRPHLANNGEVVYLVNFGLTTNDLFSTTRGQLTFEGVIPIDSGFDVNSSGEVVYIKQDTTGFNQVFSTVRGQLTSEPTDHYSPCINDLGEIVWAQYIEGIGGRTVSTTRGVLAENYGSYPLHLNNAGDICFTGNLFDSGNSTAPHVFSSVYGPLIPNPNSYQWDGGMNDAGDIVWMGSDSGIGCIYIGRWTGPGRPIITKAPQTQTAEMESTPCLAVRVDGASPLAYQWYFNGTNPAPRGWHSSLVLTNVRPAQAGAYHVIVSNRYGAVTSSPAILSVVAPVPRETVAALTLTGEPGTFLNLDSGTSPDTSGTWQRVDTLWLTNSSQWYFDSIAPLATSRFYYAWHTNTLSPPPRLDLHFIPAIALTGAVGASLRIDCINQFGPVDAWVALDTVSLSNSPQLYFDRDSIGQPPRLWRIVPLQGGKSGP